ncbi:MAG: sugar phosphate isomerase/epimerase family protein [Desertimonas sp.]
MSSFLARVGAAPISWGICEAPGWGPQLAVDRVLSEARALGITAFEQGALGWLPIEPGALRTKLDDYGMTLIGGFVPLVLHDPTQRDAALASAHHVAANLAAAGGRTFSTAIVGSTDDWFRPAMDDDAWTELFANLGRVDEICAAHGLVQAVHPHVDTLVEHADECQRFLDSCDVKLCLDTGHLSIGGTDPVDLAHRHPDRIGLVHLKDVDGAVAGRERSGELDLMAATVAGLFPSLGDGIVPIGAVIETLERAGYDGWYVMETDVALSDDDADPPAGDGPVRGVERSLAFLRQLAATVGVGSLPSGPRR